MFKLDFNLEKATIQNLAADLMKKYVTFLKKKKEKNYPFWVFFLNSLPKNFHFHGLFKPVFPCIFVSRHQFTPEAGQPTRLSESTCVKCEIFSKYTTLECKGSGLIFFGNRLLSTWSLEAFHLV